MKKFTVGLIVGIMIMVSTNAIASVGDTVTAIFASFNYVVNGETKTLDEPVLVHEGNSYLRTTQVMNMLGYDVTYKADTRTIEFNKPDEQPTPSPTPEPTDKPTPTPLPTESPEETEEPSPTPTPVDNTAQCQAIRDDYSYRITMAKYYEGGPEGPRRLKVLTLEYERDQELSALGCN